MKKRYVSTVVTEWEVRGEVSEEDISQCLKTFLRMVMMTKVNESGGYAFSGSDCQLEVTTVEDLIGE